MLHRNKFERMDFDYSKILDNRSKEYFQEAVRCYENECYRAAMSTLYCVCMCDLVYKLIDIRDEHGFVPAEEILREIKNIQATDPHKEAWESQLLDLVKERTALTDEVTYEIILQIRQWRHLSAHPAMDDENKLVIPNKEKVAGYLIDTYERLLTKSPIYAKSRDLPGLIADVILERREELNDDKVFYAFLEKEYAISKLESKDILRIFQTFWKFELKMVDGREVELAREINARLLGYIYQTYTELLDTHFSEPQNHLSISRELWDEAHKMYNFLADEDKILIRNKLKYRTESQLPFAWYLNGGDKVAHINELMNERNFCFNWFSAHYAHGFRDCYKRDGLEAYCDQYFITNFKNVHDFREAGNYYYNLLELFIDEWTLENCILFFTIVINNDQIYNYEKYENMLTTVAKRALQLVSKEELLKRIPSEHVEFINHLQI